MWEIDLLIFKEKLRLSKWIEHEAELIGDMMNVEICNIEYRSELAFIKLTYTKDEYNDRLKNI